MIHISDHSRLASLGPCDWNVLRILSGYTGSWSTHTRNTAFLLRCTSQCEQGKKAKGGGFPRGASGCPHSLCRPARLSHPIKSDAGRLASPEIWNTSCVRRGGRHDESCSREESPVNEGRGCSLLGNAVFNTCSNTTCNPLKKTNNCTKLKSIMLCKLTCLEPKMVCKEAQKLHHTSKNVNIVPCQLAWK